MKEKLEQDIPLHSIAIADNEVVWVKKGKEIRVNGKMFDIKTAKSNNGLTTFTGLYDEDETLLKKQLAESWQKKSSGNEQILSHFLASLQNIIVETSEYNIIYKKETLFFFPPVIAGLQEVHKQIITPPPQVCC